MVDQEHVPNFFRADQRPGVEISLQLVRIVSLVDLSNRVWRAENTERKRENYVILLLTRMVRKDIHVVAVKFAYNFGFHIPRFTKVITSYYLLRCHSFHSL